MTRRWSVALCVAVVLGSVAVALPAASAAHRARTLIVNVEPWTAAGKLKPGLKVAGTVKGTCWTDSLAVANGNAFRCMTRHNEIIDPCFASPRGHVAHLACMVAPWGKVTWLVLSAPISTSLRHSSRRPVVWGEQLSNGVRCENAQGAVGRIDGAFLAYFCVPGKGWAGLPLRRHEPWTARYAPSRAAKRLHLENVHIVWY